MIYQPERVLLSRIIASLVPENVGKVLDIGGGDGSRYKGLFKTHQYISVDIDQDSKPTIVASADNLPFESESVDTILSSQMLEHVVNPQRCLDEMYRVLKVGGVCIITVPFFNEEHSEPIDYYRFTRYGIIYLCENSGFKIDKFQQRGSFYTCITQICIRKLIEKYNLYSRNYLMLLFRPITKLATYTSIYLDQKFQSKANNKFALGWCLLLSKNN